MDMYEFVDDYALMLGWFSVAFLIGWGGMEFFLNWRLLSDENRAVGESDSLDHCDCIGRDDRLCGRCAKLDLPEIDERT